MKKSLLSLAIAATLTVTVGCGGGSSSGGSAPTTTTTTNATLSGTAAKGIIQAGIVTAVELNSNGSDRAVVGTAITDAQGQYQLTLGDNYAGGVVRLRISADAATKMKCDAFDGCGDGKTFGSSVDLSAGFSLDAIVQPTSSTVKVQITPLTHMAASRAVASGAVSAETVANAISEVNSIVGVNIMENEVVDITDAASLSGASPAAKQLALFNAGLAEMLVAGNGNLQTNLEKNLEDLADSFEDGQFDSNDKVTITKITEKVKEAAIDAAAHPDIKDQLEEAVDTVNTVVEVIESQTDENGEYNPEPSSGANLDNVAKAKALITNARTFIEQIGTNFEKPLDALDIEATTAADILSDDTAAMSQLLADVIGQVFDNLDLKSPTFLKDELASLTTAGYDIEIVDDSIPAVSLGSVNAKFAESSSGISITLNGTLTGNVEGISRTVNISGVTIGTNLTKDQIVFNETTGVIEQLTSVSGAQLTISGTTTATGLGGAPDTSITLNSALLSVTLANPTHIDTSDTATQAQDDALEAALTAASFDGDMTIKANGSTFTGDVEINLVDIDAAVGSDSPLSLQKIAVSGSFSGTKGSFTAGATLTIDNATSFDTYGFIDYDEELYISDKYDYYIPVEERKGQAAIDQALLENPGSYLLAYHSLYSSAVGSTARIQLDTGTIYTPLTPGVNRDAEDLVIDQIERKVGVRPESIIVTNGVYFHDEQYHNNSGYFYANVSASFPNFETVDNFVKGTLTLTSTATVPELPAATVTASVNRTNLAGGNANITVTYGGQSFKLDAASTNLDTEAPEGTLTLTNPDGVKMVVNLKEASNGGITVLNGTVSVDETQVGTVSETDNGLILVRYNDGSFESIF